MSEICIHYTTEHAWDNYEIKIFCGAEFVDGVTNYKECVTCPACLALLKQERERQNIHDLGFGQYQ
jgi:hypothetical protein